jgi:hypothetical protein
MHWHGSNNQLKLNHLLWNERCNIVKFYWKLCSQLLKNSNKISLLPKIYYFRFITQKTNTLIEYRNIEKVFETLSSTKLVKFNEDVNC